MISCLIVDDEPVSRDILKRYIRDIPSLELQGESKNAFEASEFLSHQKVDLLFLDINMPRLSGISFAKSLTVAPMMIFTTAYPEYAVEGFDLDAVDYLVKPFSFERFLKAVNRANDRIVSLDKAKQVEPNILIRSEKKIYALKPSDIIYIEACGDYIKLKMTNDKTLIVHDTMKGFLSNLPSTDFMRIHKSYALNLKQLDFLDGNTVHVGCYQIPLSPAIRQEFLDRIQ